MVVLVIGASGQLGQALQAIAPSYRELTFHFASSGDIDITERPCLDEVFSRVKPDFCINAAAYTAVDKAESEPDKTFSVNVTGARNLAEVCRSNKTTLIHISTDFVFDGNKQSPYDENDPTHPQSVYGQSKRDGELEIAKILPNHYIIRTSWLYSQFGNNFMKTMLRLAQERPSLSVVNDQTGTPTHAVDLAKALIAIILSKKEAYGIYHYSNEGTATWYDFAKKIFEVNNIDIQVQPIPTSAYPTPAKRPSYSVLNKAKIKDTFGLTIPRWDESLSNYNLNND